jgi:hypothetical protein
VIVVLPPFVMNFSVYVYKVHFLCLQMEGRTQASRSIADPAYIPGNGNAGLLGGGTYTGTSSEPLQADWEK